MRYLHARRAALGGPLPRAAPVRAGAGARGGRWGAFALMPAARRCRPRWRSCACSGGLLKDERSGPRIVPIVADEARTFGMANLFRQVGIYAPQGQRYEPEDIDSMLYYREERRPDPRGGHHRGRRAWPRGPPRPPATAVHGLAMLPFYIYYSMFGFQRVGDLIWAAADQRSRGFLVGATAGRTTLGGEGLQHQDGSSHLIASTVPNCRAWDPASPTSWR
jgi:pyruvate dehydrogenase E1 component